MSPRTLQLQASVISTDEIDGVHIVGFAEHDGDSTYILLQRTAVDTEQDVQLGHNTYHVEVSDQSHSCYGCISGFELRPKEAFIEFTEVGQAHLAYDVAQISFPNISASEFVSLDEGLQRIFRDTHIYRAGA
jgi:hypothetical protein